MDGPLVDVRRGVPPAQDGGAGADGVAYDPPRGDAFFFKRSFQGSERVSWKKRKKREKTGKKYKNKKIFRLSLSPSSLPQTLAVVASPMVATWDLSPHSAKKVKVKASRTTAGTTEAATEAKVSFAVVSAEEGGGFAAAAAAAAIPARIGDVDLPPGESLCLSVSSRSTSSSSFSHS